MAKDPVDRYATAGELILAVRRCVHDLPSAFAGRRPTFFSTGASPDTPVTLRDERGRISPAAELTGPEMDRKRSTFGTRRMVTLAACLAVLGGAIAGALLVGGGPAAASSHVAHSGALAINYRPPWARTRAAFGAFAVAPSGRTRAPAPIELGSDGATLAAGSLVDSAAIPGGPPRALVTHFGRPARETSRLASGSSAAVYHWNAVNGRSIAAWIMPTVRGDLAIICAAPVAMTTAMQACAGMATRASVSGVPLLAVGPDVGLGRSVRRIVASADTSRRTLAAAHHGRPVTTAAGIARADIRAAARLRKLDVPARYEPMLSRFASALDAEARALTALGHARGRRVYAIASGGVASASRDVASISRQASSAGLLLVGLPALSVPRLPAASTTPSGSPSTSSASTPLAPSVTTTAQPSSPSTSSSGSTSGGSSGGNTGRHHTPNPKPGSPIH